jgi:hypothetical protein
MLGDMHVRKQGHHRYLGALAMADYTPTLDASDRPQLSVPADFAARVTFKHHSRAFPQRWTLLLDGNPAGAHVERGTPQTLLIYSKGRRLHDRAGSLEAAFASATELAFRRSGSAARVRKAED